MEDHRELNQVCWDERALAHAGSPDYGFERYRDDPGHISSTVRFDLPRLGEVAGLRGVHLQCHIGTDTVSLARLGAQMSGLDFSAESIGQARRLATVAGVVVEFVVADVEDAVAVLGAEAFDLVYTGIGALCWLPEIRGWAGVVAALLRPGGRLFLREAHPVLWSLADPRSDGLLVIEYPYFEQSDPTVCDESGTYVQTDAELPLRRTMEWNHGLGEIVTALLEHDMTLTGLVEHDSVPWEALPGQMQQLSNGEWRLVDRPERLAHTYTLQAIKPR